MYKPHYTIAKGITATALVFVAQIIVDVVTTSNCEIWSTTVGAVIVGGATALINFSKHYQK